MSGMSYAQIHGRLAAQDQSSLEALPIAILRNVVLEPIEPYLREMASRMGLDACCRFGDYDNIFQEAVGGRKDLLNDSIACVLVFLRLEALSWDLARNFPSLTLDRVEAEEDRVEAFLSSVLAGIRRQTPAPILWYAFEAPLYPAYGILDHRRNPGQTAVVHDLNRSLQAILQPDGNAYYVDTNLCLARVGARDFYDSRFWHIARAPYSRPALEEIARETMQYIRLLKGRNKKCLVLDCDNVLWGGTIGEDGLSGIKLGKVYPGSAYYEIQQEILNLYNRGVVLALCSKNNEADVWEVFRRHPDMVLREEHIATAQINWQDKAGNIQRIAQDLNLALDSLVFVDDSEFEAALVRSLLPEVEVIQLPENRAVEYRDILVRCGLFDTLTFSAEDARRGAMYRAESDRGRLRAESTDLETYYASLEMAVEIRFADDFSIPRIAQLTQKTNQFNLTTRRYSESDIRQLSGSDRADVVCLRLRDRFGDSGIVGVAILKYEAENAVFDTFLLSCRVLGRRVEEVLLLECLRLAKRRCRTVAIGKYRPTSKNHQVQEFYPKQGFQPAEAEAESVRRFALDLSTFARKEPDFFRQIDSDICKETDEARVPASR